MKRLFLTFLLLAATGFARSESLDDAALQQRMEEVHGYIFSRLVHPDTKLLYDYILPLSAKDRWAHLPKADEIAKSQPNVSGWGAGMEDCALNGGIYLGSLIEAYEVTQSEQIANDTRTIYEGLRQLATIPERKGFIARAVAPDGKSHFVNSSVDQYTMYVYGLWCYFHSTIATEEEKKEIEQIMNDICVRIEDDGFVLLDAKGRPALVSDIGVIRSDRASRLLEMFRVGYDITGNPLWLEIYEEQMRENRYARLEEITNPERIETLPWKSKQKTYGYLQNQVSILPLFELETNLTIKATYLEALRVTSRLAEERLAPYHDYDPAFHLEEYELGAWRKDPKKGGRPHNLQSELHFVRDPCEAMCIILMAEDKHLHTPIETPGIQHKRDWLREECRNLLSTFDYDKMRTYAEIAYWRAIKLGLFTHK